MLRVLLAGEGATVLPLVVAGDAGGTPRLGGIGGEDEGGAKEGNERTEKDVMGFVYV